MRLRSLLALVAVGAVALASVPSAGATATTYRAQVLSLNTRAYWVMGESSGVLQDATANDLDMASATGTPDYQVGGPTPLGSNASVQYNGGEGHSSPQVAGTAVNNLAFVGWFRLGTQMQADQAIFYNGNGGANGWGVYMRSGGKFAVLVGGVAFQANSAISINTGAWFHLVVTRVAGTWKYYVDGSLDTASAGTGAPGTPSGTRSIGGNASLHFYGSNFAVLEQAVSATEAAELYTSGVGTFAACEDQVDNDSDGLTDYPADPGCMSGSDNSEADAVAGGGEEFGGFLDTVTGGLSGVMSAILCVLENLARSILAAIIMAFNAIILALAAAIRGLLFVLPPFPALPAVPPEFDTASGWMAWVFPVGTVVAIVTWFGVMWLLWQGVAIGLRWAKALNG